MNNFSTESKTLDLISKTFQNMFPSINVNNVRLGEIRRVLLLNYLEEDDTVEFRHYAITFKTTGVSKALKKVLVTKNGRIPNMGRCTDIADFIDRYLLFQIFLPIYFYELINLIMRLLRTMFPFTEMVKYQRVKEKIILKLLGCLRKWV